MMGEPVSDAGQFESVQVQGDRSGRSEGFRVWTRDEAIYGSARLVTPTIFRSIEEARSFSTDCVGVVILPADRVPRVCDAASLQSVRQACNG